MLSFHREPTPTWAGAHTFGVREKKYSLRSDLIDEKKDSFACECWPRRQWMQTNWGRAAHRQHNQPQWQFISRLLNFMVWSNGPAATTLSVCPCTSTWSDNNAAEKHQDTLDMIMFHWNHIYISRYTGQTHRMTGNQSTSSRAGVTLLDKNEIRFSAGHSSFMESGWVITQ